MEGWVSTFVSGYKPAISTEDWHCQVADYFPTLACSRTEVSVKRSLQDVRRWHRWLPGGWVGFKVDVASMSTLVELIDLPSILRNKPHDLATLAIDIPIGLLDGSRACDKAARRLLGQPRGTSVFAAPCRASRRRITPPASATNLRITGRGLSQQAWGIAPKIKQVDDAITPERQKWLFEVHPEVSFWALAGQRSMAHRKKTTTGASERLELPRPLFPDIERHLLNDHVVLARTT